MTFKKAFLTSDEARAGDMVYGESDNINQMDFFYRDSVNTSLKDSDILKKSAQNFILNWYLREGFKLKLTRIPRWIKKYQKTCLN